MRDGAFWKAAGAPVQTGEHYDLVVVGGGISGLSAAHFYRARNPSARILILDNHDDFGGHAKRNEFRSRGRLLLVNGGTWSIDSPFDYSPVAAGLLATLGIDPPALLEKCTRPDTYRGLEAAVFFDRETFGTDRLVKGVPSRTRRDRDASTGVPNTAQSKRNEQAGREASWREFLAKTPLTAAAQRDIVRIHTEVVDYMPGLTSDQKKDKLWRMSYKDYLLHIVKADPGAIPYYQTRTHALYGIGIDAVPAQDCWAIGQPGFEGLALDRTPTGGRLSFTAAGLVRPGKEYFFHFPDGNASIARLLVRSLVPGAIPGKGVEDIVTAVADYGKLDRPSNAVRIRLNSTVVGVKHSGGDPARATAVDVTYARSDGTEHAAYVVRANDVVLASWNGMIPYICPDLPDAQKVALKYGVKVPLVYTGVAIKSRRAFDALGVHTVATPGMFHSSVGLDVPVSIGAYEYPSSPDDPVVVRMERTPCTAPGCPRAISSSSGRPTCSGRHSTSSSGAFATSWAECWGVGGSIQRGTSRRSPSIAGRTGTRTSTTRCGIRRGRRAKRRTRSRGGGSGGSRSRAKMRRPHRTPTRRSIRRTVRSKNCSRRRSGDDPESP